MVQREVTSPYVTIIHHIHVCLCRVAGSWYRFPEIIKQDGLAGPSQDNQPCKYTHITKGNLERASNLKVMFLDCMNTSECPVRTCKLHVFISKLFTHDFCVWFFLIVSCTLPLCHILALFVALITPVEKKHKIDTSFYFFLFLLKLTGWQNIYIAVFIYFILFIRHE